MFVYNVIITDNINPLDVDNLITLAQAVTDKINPYKKISEK